MNELIISQILVYFVGIASGLRTDAILTSQKQKLAAQLRQQEQSQAAFDAVRPLSDDVRRACLELAAKYERIGGSPAEAGLRSLLGEAPFQTDFVEWLQAGGIPEGDAVKARLLQKIEASMQPAGVSASQLAFLRDEFFEALEKTVFADPLLANWRHKLSLQYLSQQVSELRRLNEEAAGIYSLERQTEALDLYCQKALAAWDIIDLNNLPEGDSQLATQTLLLRSLYMPLRLAFEPSQRQPSEDALVSKLEELRSVSRRIDAGHSTPMASGQMGALGTPLAIGERLASSQRLVVLGDPGGGKTTMLRWLATVYLLRHKNDPAVDQIPDALTLPARPWIPVLIRCRDLGPADLSRAFTDVLWMHLAKTELQPEEAKIMNTVILDRIAKGEILLLVDGLDEITDRKVRTLFCQQLERIAVRYPEAPIIVTSRIVGYREMPDRLLAGFEHGMISDLRPADKEASPTRQADGVVASGRFRFLLTQRRRAQGFREPLGAEAYGASSLTMLWMPPGRFWMGSPEEESERRTNEGPQHLVQLQGFFLSQTPITQAQWRQVADWKPNKGEQAWSKKLNPSPSHFKGDQRPVEQVSWDDAMEFCHRLSHRTGRNYTLPSEAQWEYACRAGTTSPFHWGATISTEIANYDGTKVYGDGEKGEHRQQTLDVASFPANPWGLQDMHGNVWEWCADNWHDNYVGAPEDGRAWIDEGAKANDLKWRMLRGGSWSFNPRYCRSAFRYPDHPDFRSSNVGFRVCCLPQD